MFVVTLRFAIQPERKRDAVSFLTAFCSQVNVLPGCRLCRFYGNISLNDGADEIFLLQRWERQSDLEKHVRSTVFQQLIEILDHSITQPELLFYQVSSATGIDLVERLCADENAR